MSTIQIHNLCSNGFDLFDDSESYLRELTDAESSLTNGGSTPACAIVATVITVVTAIGVGVGYYLMEDPNPLGQTRKEAQINRAIVDIP